MQVSGQRQQGKDNRMGDLSYTAARLPVQSQTSARLWRGQGLMAVGGILGALAASSCCILPLILFSLGISGAWIGNLTQLAPFQPYFIAATIACLGYGYWLVYRSSKVACREGQACARPMPNYLVKSGLFLAVVLVIAAIAFDFLAPLLLKS
jgi:mercuric ion transport protein